MLGACDVDIEHPRTIPPGTSDTEALKVLKAEWKGVLLAPYHAHRDAGAAPINGVDLVAQFALRNDLTSMGPVFMPVTQLGEARLNFRLAAVRRVECLKPLVDRILVLNTERLSHPELARSIKTHLLRIERSLFGPV